MRASPSYVIVMALMLAGPFGASRAGGETVDCTPIASTPFLVTTPGIYCLTRDLTTNMATGYAIEIRANNVVLDLNGHRLGNLAAPRNTQAGGIVAFQRKNITIKNGTVRGFAFGIGLLGAYPYSESQGHLIEDMRVDLNTQVGISVASSGTVIRNNVVLGTGGSTAGPNVSADGIIVSGSGNRVIDNDVIDTISTGTSFAIALSVGFDSSGTVVASNRISNRPGTGLPDTGQTRAIQVGSDATDILLVNNSLMNMDDGIVCFPGSTGKYRDTLSSSVGLPHGCTDAGNNN